MMLRLALVPGVLAIGASVAAQGQVHVVDDGATDFGAVQLLDLYADGTLETRVELGDPTPGLEGVLLDGHAFGSAAAALGDLDGNGALDLAVGAPGDDAGGSASDRGAVWIVFRAPGGGVVGRRAIRTGAGLAGALPEHALLGAALAHLGDLDGDGDTELAVGAPGNGVALLGNPGEVRILSLAGDGSVSRETRIGLGSGGFGGALDPGDRFGCALAAIGDRDGDGVGDLAVGAERDDDGGADSGALWVLHLNADGTVKSALKLSRTQGGLGSGVATGDQLGRSLCALGDVDGDAVPDLAVGARGSTSSAGHGQVWILFANADGTVRAKQRISRTEGGLVNATYSGFASTVAPAGDLNGDGTPDLLVGAPSTSAGAVFTLFLQADGTVGAQALIAGTALGLAPGDGLGSALAALGDLDGDGRLDVAAGTSGREGLSDGEFTTLQAAVDAAVSGDTVLVRSGSYVAPTIDGKGLTMVGDAPREVLLYGLPNLTVRNLPASRTVCLVGLDPYGCEVVLEDSPGVIWIEDCRRTFDGSEIFAVNGLSIDECASVVVLRSSFQGGIPLVGGGPGGAGLRASGASVVHAYDSTFLGGTGDCIYNFGFPVCWTGGPGVWTRETAQVHLTGCTAQGGDGEYWHHVSSGLSECLAGGPGVDARPPGGPVLARDSLAQGGPGGVNGTTQCAPDGADELGDFRELPGNSLSFSTGPLAREGGDIVFAFRGPPHAPVWLMGSLVARPEYRPARGGSLLLGTPRTLEFMGTLDALGELDVLVPLGLLSPGFDVRRAVLQPVMVESMRKGPGGWIRKVPSAVTLGAGTAFLVLDESF
jgi:hypothetical protein